MDMAKGATAAPRLKFCIHWRNFALMENKSYSRGLISLKYKRVRGKGKKKS